MKNIALLFVLTIMGNFLQAQNLVVNLTNGNSEIFAVSEVVSIKFGNTEMMLSKVNGILNSWAIEDIDNYSFELASGNGKNVNFHNENITSFPNPASEKVNIAFTSNRNQYIAIHIYDISGRLIHQVYEGMHYEETTAVWLPNSQGKVGAGSYFLKIHTEDKVITKSIIIQ